MRAVWLSTACRNKSHRLSCVGLLNGNCLGHPEALSAPHDRPCQVTHVHPQFHLYGEVTFLIQMTKSVDMIASDSIGLDMSINNGQTTRIEMPCIYHMVHTMCRD